MITTVTLNPMLDKTVYVEPIQKGKVHRASKVESVVGGKGVNVSRQLKKLGCETMATGFLGGEIGSMLERMLTEEGISHEFVRLAGMTREGVTYCHPDGSFTAVFEPPHEVQIEEAHLLVNHCTELLARSAWVVCSGSSPSTRTDDVFATIIGLARQRQVRTVLDSYGAAFTLALDALPSVVKLNKDEYELTMRKSLTTESDYQSALKEWIGRGIEFCMITDGPRPMYAATKEEVWRTVPPQVLTKNSTGSGDSFIAGFLYGLERQWTFERCLSFAVAAGAANARKREVACSTLEEIQELVYNVNMTRLSPD